MLAYDRDELEGTGWFDERWLKTAMQEAAQTFERAFDWWRELYRAANGQLRQAQELMW